MDQTVDTFVMVGPVVHFFVELVEVLKVHVVHVIVDHVLIIHYERFLHSYLVIFVNHGCHIDIEMVLEYFVKHSVGLSDQVYQRFLVQFGTYYYHVIGTLRRSECGTVSTIGLNVLGDIVLPKVVVVQLDLINFGAIV